MTTHPIISRQLEQLDRVIAAACAAREAARREKLFASAEGYVFVSALYSLTEAEGLWDLSSEVGRQIGLWDHEPLTESARSDLYSSLIRGEPDPGRGCVSTTFTKFDQLGAVLTELSFDHVQLSHTRRQEDGSTWFWSVDLMQHNQLVGYGLADTPAAALQEALADVAKRAANKVETKAAEIAA